MAVPNLRHKVRLQNPGPPVSDGEGGYTQSWTDLTPATWDCSIDPATARDLERVTAGTTLATASHVVRGRYHPGITTATRILFGARTLYVNGVANPEERNVETIALCQEIVA
jgi:head-tail adaptor